MKEVERSPSAHTLKGGGKEESVDDTWEKVWILGYRNPKWRKEMVELERWIYE
jgi:hypothetical protein